MQRIFSDGSPISWKVRAITSNASVESRPPESPTIAFWQWMWLILFLSPIA